MNMLITVSVLLGVSGTIISTIGGTALLLLQHRRASIVSKPKDIKMTIEIGTESEFTARQVIEKRSTTGNLKEDLEKMVHDVTIEKMVDDANIQVA